jgi:phosphoglycolate phosphatase-like HAD superfamily hydrolase
MLGKIIVFDIDGTVADVNHRRQFIATKPKNWAAWNAGMSRDPVHEDIKSIYTALKSAGARIIFCSGRGDETRAVTEKWLAENGFEFDALFMRRAGDYRQDSIVKVELLAQIRQWHGEPYIWFDDRNQVVDAIRAAGVRVLQVSEGNF